MDWEDLVNRFKFHPATESTGPQHDAARRYCGELAKYLFNNLPDSREKSVAITKLEEVMFWANAAIARN